MKYLTPFRLAVRCALLLLAAVTGQRGLAQPNFCGFGSPCTNCCFVYNQGYYCTLNCGAPNCPNSPEKCLYQEYYNYGDGYQDSYAVCVYFTEPAGVPTGGGLTMRSRLSLTLAAALLLPVWPSPMSPSSPARPGMWTTAGTVIPVIATKTTKMYRLGPNGQKSLTSQTEAVFLRDSHGSEYSEDRTPRGRGRGSRGLRSAWLVRGGSEAPRA